MKCNELVEIIQKNHFQVVKASEDENRCIIDFKHPKVKIEYPVSYFLSSVIFDKKTGLLETTVRSKVDGFKELYLDYCCENNEQKCRPHVNIKDSIFSVEAHFYENQKDKFDRLLNEMR